MSTPSKSTDAKQADNQNDSGGEYFEASTVEADGADQLADEHLEAPEVPDSEPASPGGTRGKAKKKPSAISGKKFRKRDLVRIDDLRPSLADRIRSDHPGLPHGARTLFPPEWVVATPEEAVGRVLASTADEETWRAAGARASADAIARFDLSAHRGDFHNLLTT